METNREERLVVPIDAFDRSKHRVELLGRKVPPRPRSGDLLYSPKPKKDVASAQPSQSHPDALSGSRSSG
jgi:hypothetical protein